jgi:Tol biopolymer transport system component
MKWLALTVSVAALGAATAAAARPPLATAPGLVVSQSGGIYVEGRQIAKGTQPAWSPDGTRIAFERSGELFVIDADGSNSRRLTVRKAGYHRPAKSPAWSPDGRRIAFAGTRDIFTVDLAGLKVTRLTHSERPWIVHNTPAYSPDGKRIAFSRSTDAFNSDIFVVNANGTKLRRLTTSRGTDSVLGEEHGPTWSPDGRTIVFVTNRTQKSFELWRVDVNGKNERAITDTPSPKYDEDLPRFSKDGKRLLYAHDGRIAVMNIDGTGVRELGLGTSADWR